MSDETMDIFKTELVAFVGDFIDTHELPIDGADIRIYCAPDGFTAVIHSE